MTAVEGVIHPEGKKVNYCWRVAPSMSSYDSTDTPSFTHTFSDTLQTYTVYCIAYAEGYNSMNTVNYVTTVKGGRNGSIKGINFTDDTINIGDTTYYCTEIGEQTWTMNNIVTQTAGMAFADEDIMSDVFGRFYSYDEAVKVCESLPNDGTYEWKLPTRADWETLESYIKTQEENNAAQYGKSVAAALMVNATFNGDLLWEYWPAVGDITNSSGFSAIPAGYVTFPTKTFKGVNEYAVFWTADEEGDQAYCKYLIYNQPDTFTYLGDKASFGANVRCIKK
jgi:uncharacterized protein (TIGR02145 family)